MKHLVKIFLIGICMLLIAAPSSPAKETPGKSAAYRTQPSSVFDITYAVFVWTPVSTFFNPRYIDQFEFKAGDVFSAYTTKHGELTGTWIESEIGNGTWFQAWVEKEETSTTTTTPSGTTTTTPSVQSVGTSGLNQVKDHKLKYDINIWGISYAFTPPEPFNTLTYSTIFGYGAYLGVDAFFLGFASIPGPDDEPKFGSISPEEAEQGDTLTVTITCTNTKFESADVIKVDMGAGITVGDPSVRNDNEITVSITIADDADFTFKRTVTVTVDSVSISEAEAFTVKKKTT